MGTEITTTGRSATALVADSETRCSAITLAAQIPTWVDHALLDRSFPHGYGLPIPQGAGEGLRVAAMAYAAGLEPSTAADRHGVLMGLRSGTIVRDEDALEAEATLKLIRAHLSDVPLDILQEACRAYSNAPGRRFFPRSAGELRTFINPLLFERQARATRLARLAEQADREDARAAELAADPIKPGDTARIIAEARLSAGMAGMIMPAAQAA